MSEPLKAKEEKRTDEKERKEENWVMVVDRKPSLKEGIQSKLSNTKPATGSWFPLLKTRRSENINASKTDVKDKLKERKPSIRNLKTAPSQETIKPSYAQAEEAKPMEGLAPKKPEVLVLKAEVKESICTENKTLKVKISGEDLITKESQSTENKTLKDKISGEDLITKESQSTENKTLKDKISGGDLITKELKSTEKKTLQDKISERDLITKQADEDTNDTITELRTRNKFQDWSDEEEAGGLSRTESRASRVSRAVKQLFCCGVPYGAQEEETGTCCRNYAI